MSSCLPVIVSRRGKNLRLDLAPMAGSALPRQECQGAVTRSLELAVLNIEVSPLNPIERVRADYSHSSCWW